MFPFAIQEHAVRFVPHREHFDDLSLPHVDHRHGVVLAVRHKRTAARGIKGHVGRLTAHVDFAALAGAAREAGAAVHGPVTQGRFLEALGIEARAQTLIAGASQKQAQDIRSAQMRLTDPNEMGELFKAMAIASPALGVPAGFP